MKIKNEWLINKAKGEIMELNTNWGDFLSSAIILDKTLWEKKHDVGRIQIFQFL